MIGRRAYLASLGGSALTGSLFSGCLGGGDQGGPTGQGGRIPFVLSPVTTDEESKNRYEGILEHVSEESDLMLNLIESAGWSDWAKIFADNNIVLGETLWTPFAIGGVAREDLEILLERRYRRTSKYTYSSWIVTQDPDVDLEDKSSMNSIAFGQTVSISATIFPLVMLEDAGFKIGNLPWSDGKDAEFDVIKNSGYWGEQAIHWLTEGADAAGVADFVLSCQHAEKIDEVEKVEAKGGIPHGPIVASSGLSDDSRSDRLREAFLSVPDDQFGGLWFDAVQEPETVVDDDIFGPTFNVMDTDDWKAIREPVFTPIDGQGEQDDDRDSPFDIGEQSSTTRDHEDLCR